MPSPFLLLNSYVLYALHNYANLTSPKMPILERQFLNARKFTRFVIMLI